MSYTGKGVMSWLIIPLLTLLAASVAAAQTSDAGAAARRVQAETARQDVRVEEIEAQLREEEERLAEAAARIAELSSRRLPAMVNLERRARFSDRPMLGITIGADNGRDGAGPVEGVTIRGVTPNSAAADAGLRSGDVITAVNDETLSADTEEAANRKLLDFLEGVREGDTLDVEYLRDGKAASIEIKPRPVTGQLFAFGPESGNFMMRAMPAPSAPGAAMFSFFVGEGGWADMEMVSLTSDLGRYFGTDKGLLVVRAPSGEHFKLRDGDVIQSIDGREPSSVSHALRILASYQSGETLEIEIMRDRKKQKLSIEMPDDRRSRLVPAPAPAPVLAPGRPDILLERGRRVLRETT